MFLKGTWVFFHNCQNAPQILNQIEGLLNEASSNNKLNQSFRLWVSMLQIDNGPPTSLMLNSIRVLMSPPLTMRDNIIRAFSLFEGDSMKISAKAEWPAFLHNLCYLHSCFKLRLRYAKCGWNVPSILKFTSEELTVAY